MRYFFFTFFLISICACHTISGVYRESFAPPGGYADFHFKKDGTFAYKSQYDVGGEYGNGTYRIRFGRLKLKFDHAQLEQSSPAAFFCYCLRDSTDTSRKFTLIVKDNNKQEWVGAWVGFKTLSDTAYSVKYADLDGVVVSHFPADTDTMQIKIRVTGYFTFYKTISLASYDSLRVFLYPDPYLLQTPIDSGAVWKYDYKQIDRKTIQLTEHRVDEIETSDFRVKRVRRKLKSTLVKQ